MSTELANQRPGLVPAVKVCGVTTAEDALMACDLGAELIGLNFYPPSPRAVRVEQGMQIREAIGDRASLVGVFVNRPLDEVAEIEERVALDLVQFHGDEPWQAIEPWAKRAIKVLRAGAGWEPRLLHDWRDFWAVLFDTPREAIARPQEPGVAQALWGGTGVSWSFDRVAEVTREQRVLVAGGISPENVASVVTALDGVWGIDVCSGVESSPGVKDRAKLERLFEEINHGKTQDSEPS